MQPALVLFGLCFVGASCYVLARLVLATRALDRARNALDLLQEELHASHNGGADKYRVPLEAPDDFELERDVSGDTFKRLEQEYVALANEPLSAKLKSSWVSRCDNLARRARKKVEALQTEVFWAQFAPGSEAAESRFREDPDWK